MKKTQDIGSSRTGTDKKADAISRRSVLAGAAMLGVGGVCVAAATRAAAQSKQKQADVQYQSSPKGSDKCSGCGMFQAPDACMGVEGPISPEGWCSLYSPKG